MAGKRGRVRLVIDASVLRAAGESDAPTSRHCRAFLDSVLRICHHAHASPALTAEWRRHRSRVGRLWLVQMFARKKIEVEEIGATVGADVERLDLKPDERRAVAKDLHLVETALQGDGRLVSLDESARALFARAAGSIALLADLTWVNPASVGEEPIGWLQKMCPREPNRRLGRHHNGPKR
jgi:predicted nucleic acid-binding protein